jgi:threonine/homoserine/homoserine lactone efflux protein
MDKLLLGFAVGASFGPINVLLTKRAMFYGRRAAIAFACGALLGDLVLVVACLSAYDVLVRDRFTHNSWTANVLGGAVLLLVAAGSIVDSHFSRKTAVQAAGTARSNYIRGHMTQALLLSVTNPFGILLWLAVASLLHEESSGMTPLLLSLTLLMFGDFAWFALWTTMLSTVRGWFHDRRLTAVGFVADFTVAVFGLAYLVRGLNQLLRS